VLEESTVKEELQEHRERSNVGTRRLKKKKKKKKKKKDKED
jgi:hypothetical protein